MAQQQALLDQQPQQQQGGAPHIAYSREPRPVDYQPYTFRDYQQRNYDAKNAPGYWQLGRLGPGEPRRCGPAAADARHPQPLCDTLPRAGQLHCPPPPAATLWEPGAHCAPSPTAPSPPARSQTTTRTRWP